MTSHERWGRSGFPASRRAEHLHQQRAEENASKTRRRDTKHLLAMVPGSIESRRRRLSAVRESRAFIQCLLVLFQASILRVGVDNVAANDRKYRPDVLDRVVRHGEVVVAQHDEVGVIADF
jgi:hypothetical protein